MFLFIIKKCVCESRIFFGESAGQISDEWSELVTMSIPRMTGCKAQW